MKITLTAMVMAALGAIDKAVRGAVHKMFDGQGLVSGIKHLTIKDYKENDAYRKIKARGTLSSIILWMTIIARWTSWSFAGLPKRKSEFGSTMNPASNHSE